jgi:hypothetical protein
MFLAWRTQRVITYAGYILGFPGDTPERIAHDICTVQQELPLDLAGEVHPLQGGYFRRKLRRERRAGLPREGALPLYVRRLCEVVETHIKLAGFYLYLHRIRRRVERDPNP